MPGDPAILQGVPTTLSAANLLTAIAVKLPSFWPDNIKTWLVQSELQLRLIGVTCRQTKFDYVKQAMSQSDAVKVLDLIRAHPVSNPYQHLEDQLLKMYALTDNACFEAIFSLLLS